MYRNTYNLNKREIIILSWNKIFDHDLGYSSVLMLNTDSSFRSNENTKTLELLIQGETLKQENYAYE